MGLSEVVAVSDEELVKRIIGGEEQLFEQIVERYQERLLRYAGYLVKDGDGARDVVQEAMIKAFMNLPSFKTHLKFSSWLYRIVHNEAINSMRKNWREISLEANEWVGATVAATDNVEDEAVRRETAILVRESLEELPVRYREVLALYYLEDLNYEEISDILRMPMGTVGTRIARGKKQIKKYYTLKGGEAYV